jgi:hypothetical protein
LPAACDVSTSVRLMREPMTWMDSSFSLRATGDAGIGGAMRGACSANTCDGGGGSAYWTCTASCGAGRDELS